MKSTFVICLALVHLVQGNVRGGDSASEGRGDEYHRHADRSLDDAANSISRIGDGHRDLGLIDGFCNFIGNFLPGRSTCTCTADSLMIDFECAFNKQICKDGDETIICTTPTVTGQLNIFRFRIDADICTSETRQGGVEVPGLCVNVGGNLFKGLFGGINSRVIADSVEADDNFVESCSIQIGKETCDACEICDDGKSYRFDCSEFDDTMVQSQCVALSGFKDASFLPILD